MASDSTAGGAPAATPDQTPDQMNDDLDIPNKPFRGPGDETATLIADLEKRRLELESEKADLQDKLLRALADSQNARRRAQQDVERERKFGIERFGKDVLSVADNLGRALAALPSNPEALDAAVRNVLIGVQATERELQSVLERHGVTRIESLDQPFNAEFHQAVMEVEDASKPAGTVVQEMIPGYLLAGRLLRAAMVAVSKGGPPRVAVPAPAPAPANDSSAS